jgi:hypothetical protein
MHGTSFAASLTDRAVPAHAAVAEPKFVSSPSPVLPPQRGVTSSPGSGNVLPRLRS